MARKSAKNDDSDDTDSQDNKADNAQPATNEAKGSLTKYIAIIVVVGVVLVLGYYAVSGLGGHSLSSRQIFSNVSSAGLNKTQALFVSDLEKSENVSNLQVSYYS